MVQFLEGWTIVVDWMFWLWVFTHPLVALALTFLRTFTMDSSQMCFNILFAALRTSLWFWVYNLPAEFKWLRKKLSTVIAEFFAVFRMLSALFCRRNFLSFSSANSSMTHCYSYVDSLNAFSNLFIFLLSSLHVLCLLEGPLFTLVLSFLFSTPNRSLHITRITLAWLSAASWWVAIIFLTLRYSLMKKLISI